MATLISHSPADTESIGEEWGLAAENGEVIGLCGELGAGKTQIVKGLARGLHVPGRVHSPTFTLVNIYTGGRLMLFHLDLYRLETIEQIRSAGLEEYLNPAGVTVIEWAERLFPGSSSDSPKLEPILGPEPRRLRWVHLELVSETVRRITYEDPGA